MMNRIIKTIVIIISSLFIGTCVIATTGTVQTNSLNIREKASTDSNSIGVLNKDQEVNIISAEGEWYQIQLENGVGYVKSEYIEERNEAQDETKIENEVQSSNESKSDNSQENSSSADSLSSSKVLENNVDLYVLPLINSTKTGILEEGTEINVISNSGRWLYVQADNIRGWIISKTVDTIDPSVNEDKEENVVSNEKTQENNTVADETNTEDSKNKVEDSNTTESSNGKYPVTMYVSGDSINIRSSASTTSEVISGASKNSSIKVIAKEGDWYKVDTEDGVGYIKADLLTSTKN